MLTTTQNKNKTPKKGGPTPLIEDVSFVSLKLVENADQPSKVIVRGEFARVGIPTENKRIYEQRLFEREFKRLDPALKERRLYGELDHPEEGKTKGQRVSHLITSLTIEGDRVIGEAEILDTPNGQILKAILAAGGKMGVSSRGYGSIRQNESGFDVVQEDFRLVAFDFVVDPANVTAYPDVYYEEKQNLSEEQKKVQKAAEKQLAEAALIAQQESEAALREEFAKDLVSNLSKLRTELTDEVRRELLADPAIAGAKQALESVKQILRPYILPEDVSAALATKDAEVEKVRKESAEWELKYKTLCEENDRLTSLARVAGFRVVLEQAISDDPDRKLIRKVIGNMAQFESIEDLKSKIDAIQSELGDRRKAEEVRKTAALSEEKAVSEKASKQARESNAAVDKLVRENKELRKTLETVVESARALKIRNYVSERLQNHPQAAKIRNVIESSNLETEDAVDQVLENFRDPVSDEDALQAVRARVRARVGSGASVMPEDEENPREPVSESVAGLGDIVNIAQYRSLLGETPGFGSPNGRTRPRS